MSTDPPYGRVTFTPVENPPPVTRVLAKYESQQHRIVRVRADEIAPVLRYARTYDKNSSGANTNAVGNCSRQPSRPGFILSQKTRYSLPVKNAPLEISKKEHRPDSIRNPPAEPNYGLGRAHVFATDISFERETASEIY